MLILRRTHDLIVAQLRAQLSDLQDRDAYIRLALERSMEREQALMDRLIALAKPSAAVALHPRPLVPLPSIAATPDADLPLPPDDIERWLHDQQPPPEEAA